VSESEREAISDRFPGTTARPSARNPTVRARGRRRGIRRYDREAVGDQSQTL